MLGPRNAWTIPVMASPAAVFASVPRRFPQFNEIALWVCQMGESSIRV